ncbi:MAG: sugar phosphate nucleotidyltransferase [Candidatus Tectimicrobiota bacterium]
MKAVIVAAGRGSRLLEQRPKTLMPFGQHTILYVIMQNLARAGIDSFVIVSGYQADSLQAYLASQSPWPFQIELLYNPEWMQGNGRSVLVAEAAIGQQPFVLSMADHLVSVPALQRLVRASSQANLLLVDRRLQTIFDLDDATKVQLAGDHIVHIGKELATYDGIDCGVFRLTPRFFTAMRSRLQHQEDSISAAVRVLSQDRDMQAVFLHETDFWIDIDTPRAYTYAQQHSQCVLDGGELC